VRPTSLQLETAALSVVCNTHQVPAGTQCPDGGACLDRYSVSQGQWGGWFEREGHGPPPFMTPG
jgi:hypothetical protein